MMQKTNKIAFLFLSLFGVGKIRYSPGTLASLLCIPLLFPFYYFRNLLLLAFISIVIYFYSISIISKQVDKPYDKHWIVIDEFLGMAVTVLPFFFFVEPTFLHQILAFVFFRFFDILKPLNIRGIDNLNTPSSVINDDLMAGIYSAATLTLISSLI